MTGCSGLIPGLPIRPDADFVRGRVPVDLNDSPLMFHLKARGAYGWMIHASALKRRLPV